MFLALKAAIVGTPMEPLAHHCRSAFNAFIRRRHPELAELYLEERLQPAVLRKLLTKTSSVADVGCHIGSFLSLVLQYAPNGHHVAFEASPRRAAMLVRKFRSVEIVKKAVTDFDGTARFVEDRTRPGYSHLGPGSLTVATCTLDAALGGRPISMVKLDIEGHELSALRGAPDVLKRGPPILFECGPQSLDRQEMFDLLAANGYGIMTFSDFLYNRGPMQYDEFRRCGAYPFRAINFLALNESRRQF